MSDRRDGVYRVEYKGITAGFVVKDGKVVACAPILRKKFKWWWTIAVRIDEATTDPVDR